MPDIAGLIPQQHGGALRPFTPGTGSAARRSSVRAVRREALALLAEGTPQAASRLLGLMGSPDERVAAIACAQVLDRVLGKPGETPQAGDDRAGVIDLTKLTAEECAQLAEALNTIKRLTGLSAGQAEDLDGSNPVQIYKLPDNGR